MKQILKCLLAALLPLTGGAQTAAPPDGGRPVEHQWLYGIGYNQVLDTYLSPLNYCGPSLSVWHRSERLARWGRDRVTVQGRFGGQISNLEAEADANKAWDGHFTAGVAWLYNWQPAPRTRLAAGASADLTAGFTYLLKGGNNPGQGRLHTDFGLTALAQQDFRLRRRNCAVRAQLDLPLMGAMFSPEYGQSYYEIFSLGHYSHNVRFTHPFNAPSVHWELTVRVPLAGATLTAGYLGDIRQSHVNGLKHHAWNHQFVIGYVRRLQLLRP